MLQLYSCLYIGIKLYARNRQKQTGSDLEVVFIDIIYAIVRIIIVKLMFYEMLQTHMQLFVSQLQNRCSIKIL